MSATTTSTSGTTKTIGNTLSKHRREIIYNIEEHSIVILVAEGECSKKVATEVPIYLLQHRHSGTCPATSGYNILIAQSDPTTAVQCAQYIHDKITSTETLDGSLKEISVGYTAPIIQLSKNNPHDFGDNHNSIQYMTHDVLIHEIMNVDPLLMNYSTIVIIINNEQDDRSIFIDIILGLLYKIRHQRIIHIILVLSTCNSITHPDQIESLLQYFIGKENARRVIHTTTTSLLSVRIPVGSINETKVPQSTSLEVHNWNQKGTVLSINDYPNCPVDIYYLSDPSSDYIVSMIETMWYIVAQQQSNLNAGGDILCFVPSNHDVQKSIHMAEEYFDNQKHQQKQKYNPTVFDVDFIPYTKFVQLPPSDHVYDGIRKRRRRRRVIVTNIDVERSSSSNIVIPNVQYVIDTGYRKISVLDHTNTGLDRIYTTSITKVHAALRTSYASHYRPIVIGTSSSSFVVGQCYRLFTEVYYRDEMLNETPPEITRSSHIAYVILLFKYLGIDNLLTFDFITMPDIEVIQYGLETLYVLGAIDETTILTPIGYKMAQFPIYVDPKMSRMLLESVQFRCTWEMITIASIMICTQSQYLNTSSRLLIQSKPKQNQQLLMDYNDVMSNIADPTGDHLTYWNIFTEIDQQLYTVDYDYCQEHFLHYNIVRQCIDLRKQLARFLKRFSNKIGTYEKDSFPNNTTKTWQYDQSQVLRRCVAVGYFMNVAKLGNDGQYYMIRNNNSVVVVPSTRHSFYATHTKMSNEYIIFCYPMTTDDDDNDVNINDTCIEVHHVSSIEAKWLREIAPHYFE